MLIVSKFTDYYDKVGEQYGIDKSIVYQRKMVKHLSEWEKKANPDQESITPEEVRRVSEKFRGIFAYDQTMPSCWEMEFPKVTDKDEHHVWWIINFCGQIYPVLELELNSSYDGPRYVSSHSLFIYEDQIVAKLKEKAQEPLKKFKHGRKKDNPWEATLAALEKIKSLDYSEYLYEKRIPVFAYKITLSRYSINPGSLILNPRLTDFEFWRAKDTFSAFQEIQQYISGVIGTSGNEMVVTDDKYKIIAAGHDPKTSFRKDPGKPKPRKSGKKI